MTVVFVVLKKNKIVKAFWELEKADEVYQFSKLISDGMSLQSIEVEEHE